MHPASLSPMDLQLCVAAFGSFRSNEDRRGLQSRPLIPLAAIRFASAGLRAQSSPLLEEERYAGRDALVSDLSHPICRDWAGSRSALSADDHPINTSKIER